MGTVLAVTVFAVLASARTFRETGDRTADPPQELLKLAGCRRHRRGGVYLAPSEPTIRRMVHALDADAADAQVSAWLREQVVIAEIATSAQGGKDAQNVAAVAMDGKTVRNTLGPHRSARQ